MTIWSPTPTPHHSSTLALTPHSLSSPHPSPTPTPTTLTPSSLTHSHSPPLIHFHSLNLSPLTHSHPLTVNRNRTYDVFQIICFLWIPYIMYNVQLHSFHFYLYIQSIIFIIISIDYSESPVFKAQILLKILWAVLAILHSGWLTGCILNLKIKSCGTICYRRLRLVLKWHAHVFFSSNSNA